MDDSGILLMTVPMWAPFMFLAGVCAIYPRPKWAHRLDWLKIGCWLIVLSVCAAFWLVVVWLLLELT